MTVSQAVQDSYMALDAFRNLSPVALRSLFNNVKHELNALNQKCPQSQKKDRTLYQYRYTLHMISQLINKK